MQCTNQSEQKVMMLTVLCVVFIILCVFMGGGKASRVHNVSIGDNVKLSCIFEIEDPPRNFNFAHKLKWEGPVKWADYAQEGNETDGMRHVHYLEIGTAKKEHEGIYQCTMVFVLSWQPARKGAGRVFQTVTMTDSVIISVQPELPAPLSVQNYIAEVVDGENAAWLVRLPPGETSTDLIWTTYGQAEVDPKRYKITSAPNSSLRLVLLKATDRDPKLYFIALKEKAAARVSLQLVILQRPINVEPRENEIGKRFVAQCGVPGSKDTNFTTLSTYYDRCVNDENIEDCMRFTEEQEYEFQNLRYPAVVAVNGTAESTGKMNCKVQEPDVNATIAKAFVCVSDVVGMVIEPVMKVVDEQLIPINASDVHVRDTILLTCRISYCGQPYKVRHVEWFFKSDDTLQNLFSIGNSSATAQILLTNISSEEMGRYFCKSTPTMWQMIDLSYNAPNSYVPKLAIGIFAILVVAIVTFTYFYRRVMNERRRHDEERNRKALAIFQQGNIEAIDCELGLSEQAELLPFGEEWYFPREKLKLGKILGSGFFGTVMEAEAEEILKGEEKTTVAVKMVKRQADPELLTALGKEVKIMANLGSHPFIVNLLGAVVDRLAQSELLMIVEYCRFGCLLNYLQKNRYRFVNLAKKPKAEELAAIHSYQNTGELPKFDSSVLLEWCYQMARGMEYLAGKRVVHCDLAARNVLIADDNIVKICDFGMAHDLYKKEEYIKKRGLALPLRWMAMESIEDRTFSSATDVWSFGVVLWELFTLGYVPYMEFEAFDMAWEYLKRGERLKKPEHASKSIYEIMTSCWNVNPKSRPTFTELTNLILVELSVTQRNQYIKLEEDFQFMGTGRREVEGYMPMTGKVKNENPPQVKSRMGNLFASAVRKYYNVFNYENAPQNPQARYVGNPEVSKPDLTNKPLVKITMDDVSRVSREEMIDFRLSASSQTAETVLMEDVKVSDEIKTKKTIDPLLGTPAAVFEGPSQSLQSRVYVKTPEAIPKSSVQKFNFEKEPTIEAPQKRKLLPLRSEDSFVLSYRESREKKLDPLSAKPIPSPKGYMNQSKDQNRASLEGYTKMSPQLTKPTVSTESNALILPQKPNTAEGNALPAPAKPNPVPPEGTSLLAPPKPIVAPSEGKALLLPPKLNPEGNTLPIPPKPNTVPLNRASLEGYTQMSPQLSKPRVSTESKALLLPPKPNTTEGNTLPVPPKPNTVPLNRASLEGYTQMSPQLSKPRVSTESKALLLPPKPNTTEGNTLPVPPKPNTVPPSRTSLERYTQMGPQVSKPRVSTGNNALLVPPKHNTAGNALPVPPRPITPDSNALPVPPRPITPDSNALPVPTRPITPEGNALLLSKPNPAVGNALPVPHRPITPDSNALPVPTRPITPEGNALLLSKPNPAVGNALPVTPRPITPDSNALPVPPKPNAKLPEGYVEMSPQTSKKALLGYIEMSASKPSTPPNTPPKSPILQKRPRGKYENTDPTPRKLGDRHLSNPLPLLPRGRSRSNQHQTVTGFENMNSLFTSMDEGIYDTVPPTSLSTPDAEEPPPLPDKSAKIMQVGSMMVSSREGGKMHYEKPRKL